MFRNVNLNVNVIVNVNVNVNFFMLLYLLHCCTICYYYLMLHYFPVALDGVALFEVALFWY